MIYNGVWRIKNEKKQMDQEKNIADHEMMEMERKTKKIRKKSDKSNHEMLKMNRYFGSS